jgi:hypothetical protein
MPRPRAGHARPRQAAARVQGRPARPIGRAGRQRTRGAARAARRGARPPTPRAARGALLAAPRCCCGRRAAPGPGVRCLTPPLLPLPKVRDRIASVKNTMKITEAMKLVAAAKVRRAQEAVINGRPFTENLIKVGGRGRGCVVLGVDESGPRRGWV